MNAHLIRVLFLLVFTGAVSSAQQTWQSATFVPLSPPPLNQPATNPPAPPIYPTQSGITPRIVYGNGVWYFCDGNYITPRVLGGAGFEELPYDLHFFDSPDPPNLGAEWVVALAAGDDRVRAITSAGRSGTMQNLTDQQWDIGGGFTGAAQIRDVVYSPWREGWYASAKKIFSRTGSASWTEIRGDTGEIWTSIAAGPDGVVAVSSDGKYAHLSNTDTWTIGTIFAGLSFEDVTYGGGRFVAVGESRIFTSEDGQNWTQRLNFTNADFQGAAFGNQTWVAIPKNGARVHYSVNGGTTWTNHTNIAATELVDVAYGDGVFAAIGKDGQVRWSRTNLSVTNGAATISAGGGSSAFFVNSDWPMTPWKASASVDWITMNELDLAGDGSQLINYSVSANSGEERSGCIALNNEVYVVNQVGNPAPPSYLNAPRVEVFETGYLVAWKPVAGATGFELWRNGDGAVVQVATLPANALFYRDADGLSSGQNYSYQLRVGATSSPYSPAIAFGASAKKVAMIAVTQKDIALAWVNSGHSEYSVQRNATPILTANGSTYSYLDVLSGAEITDGGGILNYQVCFGIVNTMGSGCHDVVGITSTPAAPTGVVAHPLDADKMEIRWNPVALRSGAGPGWGRYRLIGRSDSAADFNEIVHGTRYVHHSSSAGDFSYEVQAIDDGVPSAFDPEESESSAACVLRPARPLSLTGSLSQSAAALSWSFSDLNGDRFEIQQRANAGAWQIVVNNSFDSGSGAGSISGLFPGIEYNFRIRSIWRGMPSDWLEMGTQTAELGTPTIQLVNPSSAGRLRVIWAHLSGADYYEVRRSLNGTSGWAVITPAGGVTVKFFDDNSVTAGTTYYYQMRGVNSWDTSDWSATKSGVPVDNLAVQLNYHDKRRFQFIPTGSFDSLVLERSINSFSSKIDIEALAQGLFTAYYADDTEVLYPSQPYKYRVRITDRGVITYSQVRTIYPAAFPPTDLTAAANEGLSGIQLQWLSSLSGSAYEVERRLADVAGAGYEVLVVNWNAGIFVDQTAIRGQPYEYRVLSKANFPYNSPSRYSNTAVSFRFMSVESWRETNFGTHLNIDEAANSYDYDSDGLPNLMELMFGLDPKVPDGISGLSIAGDPEMLYFTWELRPDYLIWPVDVKLQSGTDLDTWPDDLNYGEPIEGTVSTFNYPLLPDGERSFFRLCMEEW